MNKKKYWQYFMNRAAAFHIGPQKIAEMLNYPVIYMKMHRLGRGYYEVSFEELSVPPYDQPRLIKTAMRFSLATLKPERRL
ncbi:hypothetical protein GP2143_05875 [marine gamma proteobacterium HTCC2143]|uniref:Uncharacterized protein n=1 Tax=marine gamma proteobacterium HTCC2143 TaxID=247633 RepID=A0YBM5_9GAMM|nr:hypothetical protein GP2143_05875 [marine gamma proteobacterium HTCC2143]